MDLVVRHARPGPLPEEEGNTGAPFLTDLLTLDIAETPDF
jgi:hypothetical protein